MKRILAVAFLFASPLFAQLATTSKVAGSNSSTVCSSGSDAISVLPGTTVYYCYSFTNLTAQPSFVTASDDHLGLVMNETVGAGNTTSRIASTSIGLNPTTNIATFQAFLNNSTIQTFNNTATVSVLFPLQVSKTLSTSPPPACDATNSISVPYGVPLYYCYQTTNLSNATVQYNVVDNQLGTLASNQTLGPLSSATIFANGTFLPSGPTLTNIATWTVTGLSGLSGNASATATATSSIPTASGTMLVLLGLALIITATTVIRLQ